MWLPRGQYAEGELSKASGWCRPCKRQYSATYRIAHLDVRRAADRQRHEHIRMRKAADPAFRAAQRQEKAQAAMRAYYREPEKFRMRGRERSAENVRNLSQVYVRGRLREAGVPAAAITGDMIDAVRAYIAVQRELRGALREHNEKRCFRCGGIKSRNHFHKNRAAHDGVQGICKDCRRDGS